MPRIKPAHSMLVALFALFVALGSGAYAASKVGTKDIKDEAVTGKKLARNAVKSNKTKDGGLKGKDLKDATITSEKLAAGATTLNMTVRSSGEVVVPPNSDFIVRADCEAGEFATGSSISLLDGDVRDFAPTRDEPSPVSSPPTGWFSRVVHLGVTANNIRVIRYVVCAST
jgi:hypothetical protein